MLNKRVFKQSLLRTTPVMVGYLVLGFAFGLLLQSRGFHPLWALASSLFVYAGSMQFVLVGLLAQNAPLTTVALTTLLVNSRHLFYGLSFVERFKTINWRRYYLIFALTDETYALFNTVSDVGSKEDQDDLYFYIAILDQLYWIIGSLAGSLVGSFVSFNSEGIEFAMTALFAVIVVEQFLNSKNHTGMMIGFCSAILSLIILGPNNFLLGALTVTLILLLVFKNWVEPKDERS